MSANLQRVLVGVVFAVIVSVGELAWADHGHGGGGGWGHGGGGWSGGHGHVSYGNFGGHGGFNNYWHGRNYWRGGSFRSYSGYRGYGWPYAYSRNYFYRPYAYNYFRPYVYGYLGYPYLYGNYNYLGGYYGYPSYYYSYPSDYFVGDSGYIDAPVTVDTPPTYVVSRPVQDVARVEIRLPDPQGTLWVQGQEISSSGSVRHFRSPQLDPSQQYTYTVKAEWNDNGRRVVDERRVKVQANALAVVDFSQPNQAGFDARQPAMPDLPPPQQQPAIN